MKNSITAVVLGLIVACTTTLNAATFVKIDFGPATPAPQDVESGFDGFDIVPVNNIGSYDSLAQAFGTATWRLTASNLDTFGRKYADIPAGPNADLLEDSYNTNQTTATGTITLTFDNLDAGPYLLTTFHHSARHGGASADVSGAVEGSSLASLGSVTSTTGDDISSFTTLEVIFTVTDTDSEDGYTLEFTNFNAGPNFHFDFSGFALESAVPEPTTLVVWGALAMAFVAVRRKRRVH